jgi:hypothetical protein
MTLQRLFFILAIFCFTNKVEAQILVQKIPNENLCAIDFDLMNKGYQLAFSNMTSEEYLFKGREEEWKKCWIDLMHDLSDYMKQKGLKPTSNTTCFNRIYFNKEGNIIAYLYHVKGLNIAQEQKFNEAIFQFLITQKVSIKAPQNYWQYGTLKFE